MIGLSPGGRFLYLYLSRCRNGRDGRCFPSVKTTAEYMGIHPKSVFRLRRELEAKGWATFDGDEATLLMGFNGNPQVTHGNTEVTNSNTTVTNGNSNVTPMVTPRLPLVTHRLPDGNRTVTPYKEEPAKEPANRTSKGEPTRERAPDPSPDASGLEPLIAILADHYKLYVEPNRRWYEQAARAVLARHQGEAAAERLSAFLRAKPGQKLTFFATDFASWDAGTAKLRAAAGIGSYSPDFDIAPGTECLDGLTEDELEVLRAKVLSSPTCIRFDQWEPDKAEAYIRIEMAAIAKQETVNA